MFSRRSLEKVYPHVVSGDKKFSKSLNQITRLLKIQNLNPVKSPQSVNQSINQSINQLLMVADFEQPPADFTAALIWWCNVPDLNEETDYDLPR